jgi:muramidase (phage lysozyme)
MAVILPAANLPREARALLIAIAQGESDPSAVHAGISPYFILYGGGSFEGFPDRPGYNGFPLWSGKDNSHAAGRFQFEPKTWQGTCANLFPAGTTPQFRNPADQDWGAWLLAQSDYHSRTGGNLLVALRSAPMSSGIGGTLRPTWTSMSDATFPARYNAAIAAVVAAERSEPTPVPIPPAPPAPVPTPAPVEPDLDNALIEHLIAALQAALALDSLYDGKIDGKPGPKTYQAMQDYAAQK